MWRCAASIHRSPGGAHRLDRTAMCQWPTWRRRHQYRDRKAHQQHGLRLHNRKAVRGLVPAPSPPLPRSRPGAPTTNAGRTVIAEPRSVSADFPDGIGPSGRPRAERLARAGHSPASMPRRSPGRPPSSAPDAPISEKMGRQPVLPCATMDSTRPPQRRPAIHRREEWSCIPSHRPRASVRAQRPGVAPECSRSSTPASRPGR